jgi:hypothetical protein
MQLSPVFSASIRDAPFSSYARMTPCRFFVLEMHEILPFNDRVPHVTRMRALSISRH